MAKSKKVAASRAARVQEVYAVLRGQYDVPPRPSEPLPLLEELLLAILCEDAPEEAARQGLQRLKSEFLDWNEVRVSAVQELAEVLDGLSEPDRRATRVKQALRHIFESIYSYNIDGWKSHGVQELQKRLGGQEWFTPFVQARLARQAFDRHAIGIDNVALRVWKRLGIAPPDSDGATFEKSLQRLVTKDKAYELEWLVRHHGLTVCVDPEPRCQACLLLDQCPTGQSRLAEEAAVAATERSSSRRRGQSETSPVRRAKTSLGNARGAKSRLGSSASKAQAAQGPTATSRTKAGTGKSDAKASRPKKRR
jgi:endonuclease-3